MKRKVKMTYLQQGDVLLHRELIPRGEFEKTKSPVLQEGEHTGHAHRLHTLKPTEGFSDPQIAQTKDIGFEVFRCKSTGTRYLKVTTPMALRHEEHKEIAVPPGEYRIGIVQEYDHFAEEAREVKD